MKNDVEKKIFALFLKLEREKLRMNQREFSQFLGISHNTIRKWETQKCLPDFFATLKLLRIYPKIEEIFAKSQNEKF